MTLKTQREPLDFYPTPRAVTGALIGWMLENADGLSVWTDIGVEERFLDPAAGEGDIIKACRSVEQWREAHWSAIEMDPSRAHSCELVAEDVHAGDALELEWPDAHVIANPPFRSLDEFWLKACAHRERRFVWVAVFTPIAWWHAERRADYVKPDHLLALGWRPSFRPKDGPGHKGSQDFAWAVLEPLATGRTEWWHLKKPTLDQSFELEATP